MTLVLLITLVLFSCILKAKGVPELTEIKVQGEIRHYRIYIPTDYQKSKTVPLVLSFHGSSATPAQQVAISDIEKLAEKEGFIAVTPAAIYKSTPDGPNTWNVDKDPLGVNDVSFVSAIIAEVSNVYNIDKERVYATGFSGGARMSSRLACDLSTQIAAVAPVAGIRFPADCKPSRSVPVITFHGTQDNVNHYKHGDSSPLYWRMGVEDALFGWVKNNGCEKKANSRALGNQVTRLSYINCRDGGDIVFYKSTIAGHTWPGSESADLLESYGLGKTDKQIPASELIWTFFNNHSLKK